MKKKIFNCLNELGVPFNLAGREYLETAILMVLERGKISITKELYPVVAEKHNTTASRVERSIRHSIEACIDNTDPETMEKYFGNTISACTGKTVNSSFVYGIAKYIEVFESEET